MDTAGISCLPGRFAAAMHRLGPFEPHPRLAAAVSGGADSMALALLARDWVSGLGGSIQAVIIDHALRPESAQEADLTLRRLTASGIPGQVLRASGLVKGPALAERARDARYRLLLGACASAGIPHLLLGHHRGDQVETVMMRVLSGSASRGLAGMPALAETRYVRLARPLLTVAQERLREYLVARGVGWVEDPSNRDPGALRARLRAARADPSGTGEGIAVVAQAARTAGRYRADRDLAIARILAARASIHPEGYAVLTPGPLDPEAMAALLRTIAGTPHGPSIGRVAALALAPGPATIGGVRIMAAGRLGPGWLLVRERRAMDGPVAVCPSAIWDGRFRLTGTPPDAMTADMVLGALGATATRFRGDRDIPAAVLHGLPALWSGGIPVAVPHIGVGHPGWRVIFDPRNPAAGAPFVFG